MEQILDIIIKNYTSIMITFAIIVCALIGYLVDKKRSKDLKISKKKSKLQEIMELTENEEISEEKLAAMKDKTLANIQQQNQENVENL
jgi:hypothetical protein